MGGGITKGQWNQLGVTGMDMFILSIVVMFPRHTHQMYKIVHFKYVLLIACSLSPVMVDVMYQQQYSAVGSNVSLDVSVKLFLDEINI